MKLKDAIIQELKSTGNQGINLKDLASKLGATSTQLSIWFGTTGKKMKEIVKLGRGQYAWTASPVTATSDLPAQQ
jgi:AraC-like DNA-binding protein